MKSKYLKLLPILLSIVILSNSCQHQEERRQPNISKVKSPKQTIRLEQELYKIPAGETRQGLLQIEKKYPELLSLFLKGIMNINDTSKNQNYTMKVMDEYLHHPQMIALNDTIQLVFKNFNTIEKELDLLIQNYAYYFPQNPRIQLFTYTSQFGPRAFFYPPYLGIGLDLYLGKDYKYYASMGFPNFFIQRLEKKYIATDAAFILVQDMKDEPLKRGATLLDMMIYYGKIYYVASMLLPERKLADFFYYTDQNWKWCKDNEKQIWSFFIDGDWLYDNSYLNYSKFIEDAPTTLGMPAGAPDRVGRWTGYQIVKKYMEKYPKTSLTELINLTSGQEILTKSGYKPFK